MLANERARDLIQRDFAPRSGTDRRYAGDITYIMTWEGWAYLSVTWITLRVAEGIWVWLDSVAVNC